MWILACLFLFFGSVLQAQDRRPCSEILRDAEQNYIVGVLTDIPSSLGRCVEEGFTKEERLRAQKLITLCFIYTDNMAAAEGSMVTFLRLDPEYQLNESVDPPSPHNACYKPVHDCSKDHQY